MHMPYPFLPDHLAARGDGGHRDADAALAFYLDTYVILFAILQHAAKFLRALIVLTRRPPGGDDASDRST